MTIEDVAARCGVSVATVSRAMRGLPNVSPSTRAKVMNAITEMDFRPDRNAARLAAGRSGTIAVAAVSLQLWYTAQVVSAVEAVLTGEGQDVLVVTLGDGTASSLAGGVARRVDGVIVLDVIPDEFERSSLRAMRVPWVLAGGRVEGGSSVWIDNVRAGRIATRHLLELGHERVGVVGGGPTRLRSTTPEERLSGHRAALQEAGIEFDPDLVVDGNFSVEGGAEAFRTLFASSRPPTAIFAMSDEMAFGVLQAARETGVSVPADLSLVGFDDHDLARTVGLTTMRQDPSAMAAAAARLLLDRLTEPDREPESLEFAVDLVVRETTAAAAGLPPARHRV